MHDTADTRQVATAVQTGIETKLAGDLAATLVTIELADRNILSLYGCAKKNAIAASAPRSF